MCVCVCVCVSVWYVILEHEDKNVMWRMSSGVDVENERAEWMWRISDEDICDRLWENRPLRAQLQNRVIGIQE